jgi:hypothetical protein
MDDHKHQWVEYYIIFTKSDLRHMFTIWLNPEFQHCYAVKKSEGGQFWMIINPKRGFTQVDLKTVDEFPTIRALLGWQPVILSIKSKVNTETRWRLWHLDCVEIVKTLLGVNDFWIWTPRQLYKYLVGGG